MVGVVSHQKLRDPGEKVHVKTIVAEIGAFTSETDGTGEAAPERSRGRRGRRRG